MARKSDSGSSPPADKTAAHLTALRGQIDKLDLTILEALNKRAAIAAQIGKVKADQGGDVFSAAREEEVFGNVLTANAGPLDAVTVRAIFRELISGSRAIQKQQKVAYLGPEFSYSHLAALQRFGEAALYNRTANIAAVFEQVSRRHADFGVVPLENSTDGRIADTARPVHPPAGPSENLFRDSPAGAAPPPRQLPTVRSAASVLEGASAVAVPQLAE